MLANAEDGERAEPAVEPATSYAAEPPLALQCDRREGSSVGTRPSAIRERWERDIEAKRRKPKQRHRKPAVATVRHHGTTATFVERPLLSPEEHCSSPGAEETVPNGRVVLARGAGLCETTGAGCGP